MWMLTASKRRATAANAFVVCERLVCSTCERWPIGVALVDCIPRTTSESVPSVSDAVEPTLSVSATLVVSRAPSGECDADGGDCEGAAEATRESLTSRKGLSGPAAEGIISFFLKQKHPNITTACRDSQTNGCLRWKQCEEVTVGRQAGRQAQSVPACGYDGIGLYKQTGASSDPGSDEASEPRLLFRPYRYLSDCHLMLGNPMAVLAFT